LGKLCTVLQQIIALVCVLTNKLCVSNILKTDCNWRNSLIFSSAKVHTRIAVFDTSGAGNYQYPIRAQQVDSFEVKV